MPADIPSLPPTKNVPRTLGPQRDEQFREEQTAENKRQVCQGAVRGRDPGLVANLELARDEGNEDVGQDAEHVEHDERQRQVVLGARRQEALRLAPRPPVPRQPQRVAAVAAGWELRKGRVAAIV
jgi:hypothetical protein